MEDYCFVKIPYIKCYYHHDFINGGHKWPICGTTISSFSAGAIVTSIRGEQSIEAGYVWAPYIPMTDLEAEFAPRLGLASRYATREINPNLYGRITVNELYNGVQLPKVNRMFT